MSCPALIDPGCVVGDVIGKVAGAGAAAVTNDALSSIASAVESGVAWITANSISWWVKLPSPDLATEPAVTRLQQWILPVAVIVAVLGVIVAGAKMAITRKANPLIDTGTGLATIAITSSVGVLAPTLMLKAGDAWSNWVLNASTGGQFGARLTALLAMTGIQSPAVITVLGIVAIILGALQALLMVFRQGALVIIAGMLPLAAVGTLMPATRGWWKHVTGWGMALIWYKPAAAAVYAVSFTLIGTGKNVTTVVTGFAMEGLSLVALPALMKLFTWTAGQVESGGGGGGFMQAALSGAVAVGALRGNSGGLGGGGAADQARQQNQQLGPADGGPSGARTPAGAAPPGPAAGAGAATRAPSAGTPAPGTATGAQTATGAGTTAAASSSAVTGAASGASAGATGGPWGAAAGAANGAVRSGANAAASAMQPPQDQQGDKR
ncbi:MAG TPA: hypothetical protein VF282_03280 [Bacillota bacterium]